jgi:alpha-L-rhamnosidase
MVHTVAGLDLDERSPGYKHIVVHPQPGGGLTSARAELLTEYGSALAGWKLDGGRLNLSVRVPPNTHGTVRLPRATLASVTEGGRPLASAAGITGSTQNGEAVVIEIGSGEYAFEYPYSAPATSRTGTNGIQGR